MFTLFEIAKVFVTGERNVIVYCDKVSHLSSKDIIRCLLYENIMVYGLIKRY